MAVARDVVIRSWEGGFLVNLYLDLPGHEQFRDLPNHRFFGSAADVLAFVAPVLERIKALEPEPETADLLPCEAWHESEPS